MTPSGRLRPFRSLALPLLFAVAFLAPSCVEVESTITFEPDGSGTTALDLRMDLSMLEAMGEHPNTEDRNELREEFRREALVVADTLEGITVDTVWMRTERGVTRMHASLRFTDVAALRSYTRDREERAEFGAPPVITHEGAHLTVVHPRPTEASSRIPADQWEQLGQMLAMNMIDGRFRYVFPEGTELVSSAPEAIRRADGAMVYEITLAELMGTAGPDNLYVEAALPAGPPWSMLLLGLGALLVGGAIWLLFR